MASWMIHFRVADVLLDKLSGINETEFVMGNIAPDSGIPNEDWSVFTPSSEVSHFRTTDADGLKEIHEDWYIEKYFTKEKREVYDTRQYSFFLGYLTHLLTDKLWVRDVVKPLQKAQKNAYTKNPGEWFRQMKAEWHVLDIRYLQENPNFRAFMLYEQAAGFRNTFMDFFSEDAFDDRRAYITESYRKECKNELGETTFLKEEDMQQFVENAAKEIAGL